MGSFSNGVPLEWVPFRMGSFLNGVILEGVLLEGGPSWTESLLNGGFLNGSSSNGILRIGFLLLKWFLKSAFSLSFFCSASQLKKHTRDGAEWALWWWLSICLPDNGDLGETHLVQATILPSACAFMYLCICAFVHLCIYVFACPTM